MMCPCLECKDRVVGCHGTCELYKAWKTNVNRLNAIARKKKEKERL